MVLGNSVEEPSQYNFRLMYSLSTCELLSREAFMMPRLGGGRDAGKDRYVEVLRKGFDCVLSPEVQTAPRMPVLGEQSVQARGDLPASSLQGRRSPAES